GEPLERRVDALGGGAPRREVVEVEAQLLSADRDRESLRDGSSSQKARLVRPDPAAPVDEIGRDEQSRRRAGSSQQRISELVSVARAVVNSDGGQSRRRPFAATYPIRQAAQRNDVVTLRQILQLLGEDFGRRLIQHPA